MYKRLLTKSAQIKRLAIMFTTCILKISLIASHLWICDIFISNKHKCKFFNIKKIIKNARRVLNKIRTDKKIANYVHNICYKNQLDRRPFVGLRHLHLSGINYCIAKGNRQRENERASNRRRVVRKECAILMCHFFILFDHAWAHVYLHRDWTNTINCTIPNN